MSYRVQPNNRRRFINIPEDSGRDPSNYDPFFANNDGVPDGKQYCPDCRTLLYFSNKVGNFRCANCGYIPEQERPKVLEDLKAQQDQFKQGRATIRSSSSGAVLPQKPGAPIENSYDQVMRVQPMGKPRKYDPNSIEAKRKRFPGYDNDMARLEARGYRLIKSTEIIGDDRKLLGSSNNNRES